MKFVHGRVINRMAIPITRMCNRHCPDCMAWARTDPSKSHVSTEELRWAGAVMGPIQKIEITGGEPTLHPDFEEISEHIHEWFQCKDIMLLTNGYLFDSHPDKMPLLLCYDRVYVTHYTHIFKEIYGTPVNTDVHDKIQVFIKDYPQVKFWSQVMNRHDPIGKPPYRGACPPHCQYDKGDSLAYYRGQLYGCCTAWQLPYKGRGILLTKDWRNHTTEIELPCEQCFLTGEKHGN
jgi:organic radical activating enzyme